MVDVGGKPSTAREAIATGRVVMSPATVRQIRRGNLKKGDPLQTARLAGIMAAKRTSELIPLCHPLALTFVDVALTPVRETVRIHPDEYGDEAGMHGSALIAYEAAVA